MNNQGLIWLKDNANIISAFLPQSYKFTNRIRTINNNRLVKIYNHLRNYINVNNNHNLHDNIAINQATNLLRNFQQYFPNIGQEQNLDETIVRLQNMTINEQQQSISTRKVIYNNFIEDIPDYCPVCAEEGFHESDLLSCGHYVHKWCIIRSKKTICPVCRAEIELTDIELEIINDLKIQT
jgi:hypothetical protein